MEKRAALWDLLPWSRKSKNDRYAQILNGTIPIYSQFGENIYVSDIVQNSIDVIATEISKLQPRHIRTDDEKQVRPKSSLNRILRISPNPVMTTSDFLERIIWQLYLNYNCFIFPTFEVVTGKRVYTGLYPLSPTLVEFLQDPMGTMLIKMTFANGKDFTLLYSDVIHLRKKFSMNDLMGGGANGQPNNEALLRVLKINDLVLQMLPQAIKTSMSVRGVLKVNTVADTPALELERQRVTKELDAGNSGFITTDLKGDYTAVNTDPKLIDKETLDFLQAKVLNWYGVSFEILSGKFSDTEYQAFYEKTLEPIIIRLGQAFTKTLFSPTEIDFGNEIVFYQKDVMYLSTPNKINLLKITGEQGLLSDNQKLALLGYPPKQGGNRVTQSLNYMDTTIITQYQMARAKGGKQPVGKE